MIDAGFIVEAQELESYKAVKVLQFFSDTVDEKMDIKVEQDIDVVMQSLVKQEEGVEEPAQQEINQGSIIERRMNEFHALLMDREESKESLKAVEVTKSSCALRAAIVHNALQRTTHKKCIHCRKSLRYVKYMQQKLVHYMTLAEMKSE